MGLLSKLFGKAPAQPSVGGGGMSIYAMTLQQKGELSSRRCGLDGQTFPCPSVSHTILTTDISGFSLDVGGYCPTCKDFRCHDHVEFKSDNGISYGIFCRQCGTQVTGVSA